VTDSSRDRPARIEDITDAATAMPDVVRAETNGRPSYSVDGKVFVFHREPRKDAFDPETGERYDDVIAFYVADLDTKDALVNDEGTPWFTTPHWNGYRAVLLRGSRIGELTRDELVEQVQEAWLARVGKRKAKAWLDSRPG
jgi:hypothetical protein